MKAGRKTCGFTLIETLVVVSIIGLLLALLIPAAQAARSAAWKIQCANNLKQLALAAAHYHETYGLFPPVMTTGPPSSSYLGFYAPHVRLLPYLDQGPLYHSINFQVGTVPPSSMSSSGVLDGYDWTLATNLTASSTTVGVFLCPSDTSATVWPGNNYRGNVGVGPASHVFAEFKDSGNGVYPEVELVGAASIPDGLSNTAGFSERLRGTGSPGPDGARGFFPYQLRAENADLLILACRAAARVGITPYQLGGHYWFWSGREHTLYCHAQTPNGEVPDCLASGMIGSFGMATARSLHGGGVNVAMTDGSVRFVPDSIAGPAWRAIGTRNGGEPTD